MCGRPELAVCVCELPVGVEAPVKDGSHYKVVSAHLRALGKMRKIAAVKELFNEVSLIRD